MTDMDKLDWDGMKARSERLERAIEPFAVFVDRCQRLLETAPDLQITQGSPMAGPQLYARDFLALRAALQPEKGVTKELEEAFGVRAFDIGAGKVAGASDMRERAAKLVERGTCTATGRGGEGLLHVIQRDDAKAFADKIRSLPIEEGTE